MTERGAEESPQDNTPGTRRSTSLAHMVRQDMSMIVMVFLGALIIWQIGWLYALLYLIYFGFSLLWFMRFLCTHCGNSRLGRCPSGLGNLSPRLFAQRPPRRFRSQFTRHIAVTFPWWFVPPLVAVYLLVTGFTVQVLALLVAFSLVGSVILPLGALRTACGNCAMRKACPWGVVAVRDS